ncbi:MAG: hypothetical protein IJH67_06735 [Thermoguttaceae bacterium]|nr:hypothetical protein [Thermoguttaceae bacterium]
MTWQSFFHFNNNQPNANPDARQPILPFRLRPYRNMLALSVGLFIIIPLLACVVFAVLSLVGYLSWFLSWSLGIITASAFLWWVHYYNENHPYYGRDDNEESVLITLWFVISILVTCFTYSFLNNASVFLLDLSTVCWKNLITLYEQSGIVYWSWIPIGSMIIYGAVSLISLWIMKLLDWHPHWGRVRFICPHENCGHVSSSIVYKCPHCGEALRNLYPSRYGIFYTTCPSCGLSLNASWLTGRNQYSKTCPDCNRSLNYDGFGNLSESVFVVEGAPKSGKTSFLVQALNLWNQQFKSYVHFSDNRQKKVVRQMAQQIKTGVFCPPTERLSHPEAYLIRCKKSFHSFLAYFYDAGGETSRDLDAGTSELYYNLANGIFLVIDPWAEDGILTAFGRKKKNLRYSKYQFASQDADAIIGRLCNKLEHIYPESLNAGFDVPICVVVTKCDLNGLDKMIGSDEHFTQSSIKWEEQSKKVEEFLINHGKYNFVNVVKTRFKKNAFFAVSALKDSSEGSDSILNPLLWMTYNS